MYKRKSRSLLLKPEVSVTSSSEALESTNESGETKVVNENIEARGAWSRDESLLIESNIDDLRLDGYSDAEIQERYPYSKELIVEKKKFLIERDRVVGEETDVSARKRELDLQYLRLIKSVKEKIAGLPPEATAIVLMGQKLIKEIISERAKLWGVDGKVSASTSIRMNNVENVVLGGSLSKKQLNIIGDIISGKVNPEEIKKEEESVVGS